MRSCWNRVMLYPTPCDPYSLGGEFGYGDTEENTTWRHRDRADSAGGRPARGGGGGGWGDASSTRGPQGFPARQKPEEAPQHAPPEASAAAGPCQHLDFRFLASCTLRMRFCGCKPPSSATFYSPGKQCDVAVYWVVKDKEVQFLRYKYLGRVPGCGSWAADGCVIL